MKKITLRTKYSINIFSLCLSALLILSGCKAPQESEVYNSRYHPDSSGNQIVERYVLPEKVHVLTDSSEAVVENTNALLTNESGQADLVGSNQCIMKSVSETHPAILLDFGIELQGGIEIVTGAFDNSSPLFVRITLGESVSEALSQVENSSATNDHAIRDFKLQLPWLGKIKVGNSGFRFAKIELLGNNKTLKLKEVRAISAIRDIPYLGSFKCNDERLNEIWQTGAYTVHLNMQEYLWDGIKRDRLVWVGDMHPEVMTILSVFGYNEVVPKSLNMIKEITPLPGWMNGISSYSMWWLLIQHQWYMNTGDLEYLKSHQDYIYNLLDHLAQKIDDGGMEILDGHRFLDWPTSPNKAAIHAGLQSLLIMTFEKGAEMATIFNDPTKSKECLSIADQLKNHLPSPNGSKSGGALMALSGLSDSKAMNDSLLSIDPTMGISTFYGYYVLKARAEAGDVTGALNVIRAYWGGMLDLGATTFWEDFDLSWKTNATRIDEMPDPDRSDVHADNGDYCYVGLRNSLCHGWASGPTAWMSEYILGIKPLSPGCTKVLIAPNLGDLEWVEGSYPTPLGLISVRYTKSSDGQLITEIDAPKGIEIELQN